MNNYIVETQGKAVVLENGIDLTLYSRPETMTANICICIPTGRTNEPMEKAGISHFIEHMAFNKTRSYETGQIKYLSERKGCYFNASTSETSTFYEMLTPTKSFEEMFDIILEAVFFPVYTEENKEKEKEIILHEIRQHSSDIYYPYLKDFKERIYTNNFKYEIGGTEETVSNITVKDLEEFHRENYYPENAKISIVGNFDEDYVIKRLNEIKQTGKTVRKIESPKYAENEEKFEYQIQENAKSANVQYNFILDNNKKSDYITSELLDEALSGGGLCSLLFDKLREERGLCYHILSLTRRYKETQILIISSSLAKEDLEEFNYFINKELKEIVNSEEFEYYYNLAKEKYINKACIQYDSNQALSTTQWNFYKHLGKMLTIEELNEEINKKTIEDIRELFNRFIESKRIELIFYT